MCSYPQILTSAVQALTTVPRSALTLLAPILAVAAQDSDLLIVEGLVKVIMHFLNLASPCTKFGLGVSFLKLSLQTLMNVLRALTNVLKTAATSLAHTCAAAILVIS